MQNLLRTLTELQSKSPQQSDLKLLLTTVKEARVSRIWLNACFGHILISLVQRQFFDTKLSDPFYDSLEGLLHDLRTVTVVSVMLSRVVNDITQ